MSSKTVHHDVFPSQKSPRSETGSVAKSPRLSTSARLDLPEYDISGFFEGYCGTEVAKGALYHFET